MSFFSRLLDDEDFVTRGHCGDWSRGHALVAQLADLAVAFAYFSIPIALYVLWRQRQHGGVRHAWMVMMFVAFILLCGATHVCQVLAFHWPAYRFFTTVTVLTAAASLVTAFTLPWVVSDVLADTVVRNAQGQISAAQLQANYEKEIIARQAAEALLEAEKTRRVGAERALEEARLGLKAKQDSAIIRLNQSSEMVGKADGPRPPGQSPVPGG